MTTATFYLYEPIVEDTYSGGISPAMFVEFLNGLDNSVDSINIRLNSPGGSVFAARAIEQLIKESKIPVNTYIDGLCASAASYIGLAGKTVNIGKGAFLMMHLAQSVARGNTHDLIKNAELLAKIDAAIVDTYHAKTGIDKAELLKILEAETWLNAEEAVAMGFADIINENELENKPVSNWKNSAINFDKAPEAFKNLMKNVIKETPPVKPEMRAVDVAALLRRIELAEHTF